MKRRTNFDLYLAKQMKDPEFTKRFKKAGEAWVVAESKSRYRVRRKKQ